MLSNFPQVLKLYMFQSFKGEPKEVKPKSILNQLWNEIKHIVLLESEQQQFSMSSPDIRLYFYIRKTYL